MDSPGTIRYGVSVLGTGPGGFNQSWYAVFQPDGNEWVLLAGKGLELPDYLVEEIGHALDQHGA